MQKYKLFIVLVIVLVAFLTSCENGISAVESQLNNLTNKANQLDSVINTEMDKVIKLDSIINLEDLKVKKLDSIVEKTSSNLDSILNKYK
ncbi:hypothetical protein [Aequorivita sp. CIP111184]|uniref:hypothetical protein n=1 Tax=Aequorivita sp. CIP111184 TaxID=2211356 RepID=UPI000DBBE8E6|nr:hypothetical protein [Aequorivita sp. CIP111184]SRX55277.1 hypothetical protein AEQU1_02299 [Aequorivita sp. CIP111184]